MNRSWTRMRMRMRRMGRWELMTAREAIRRGTVGSTTMRRRWPTSSTTTKSSSKMTKKWMSLPAPAHPPPHSSSTPLPQQRTAASKRYTWRHRTPILLLRRRRWREGAAVIRHPHHRPTVGTSTLAAGAASTEPGRRPRLTTVLAAFSVALPLDRPTHLTTTITMICMGVAPADRRRLVEATLR